MNTILTYCTGKANRATVTLLSGMTLASAVLLVAVTVGLAPVLLFQSLLFVWGIATVWCYLRFVLTSYRYSVEEEGEGQETEQVLVILCGTDRRMSVMARLSLDDLVEVRRLTPATLKEGKQKNHQNYAAHFRADSLTRLTFRDGEGGLLSADLEADDRLAAYLASYTAEN